MLKISRGNLKQQPKDCRTVQKRSYRVVDRSTVHRVLGRSWIIRKTGFLSGKALYIVVDIIKIFVSFKKQGLIWELAIYILWWILFKFLLKEKKSRTHSNTFVFLLMPLT